MEPSVIWWCPGCSCKVSREALRCRWCGTPFRGPHGHKPTRAPDPQVTYGNHGPEYDEEGQLLLAGIALSFHPTTFPLDGGADERSDGHLHDPGSPGP